LTESLDRLDAQWTAIRDAGQSSASRVVKAREAAAMLATSRLMYRSALARTETRGMHKREDYPALDAAQRHHLVCAGLDEIAVGVRAVTPRPLQEIAA
jgi:succinate dehydrogenase/fumarate reductase flavoprotein subunit